MRTTDLVEGMVVRLTQAVDNPHPDRRRTGWGYQPIWAADTRFLVRQSHTRASAEDAVYDTWQLEPVVKNGILYTLLERGSSLDAFVRVLAHADPCTEMLDDVMRAETGGDGWGYEHALKVLLHQGKVTMADVRVAFEIEETPEA